MSIHQDKGPHLLLGLAMLIIGAIGLGQEWLGQLGGFLFLGILSLGFIWTILGGVPFFLLFFLMVPFSFLGYVLFLPVKKRGDKVYYRGTPVVAYWMRDDRIVLGMHYFVDASMNTIGGELLFRGPRKLARTKEMLDSVDVPEHPMIEEQLTDAVEVWNQDAELRRRVEARRGIDPSPSEALVVLDEPSKERVDRVHWTIDFLWDSEKYRDMRQEIIQLAIWNALAIDVCYGGKRGLWKEIV